jgi:hypothetical protein
MEFEITKEQEQEIEIWKKSLPFLDQSEAGAAGGMYSYIFTPTGLGTIVEIRRIDGEKLDLTDWDNFG